MISYIQIACMMCEHGIHLLFIFIGYVHVYISSRRVHIYRICENGIYLLFTHSSRCAHIYRMGTHLLDGTSIYIFKKHLPATCWHRSMFVCSCIQIPVLFFARGEIRIRPGTLPQFLFFGATYTIRHGLGHTNTHALSLSLSRSLSLSLSLSLSRTRHTTRAHTHIHTHTHTYTRKPTCTHVYDA